MKLDLILSIAILLLSVSTASAQHIKTFQPWDKFEYDTIPYMVKDPVFEESFNELTKMFAGKIPYNLKRAEFLVENAYHGGTMNYINFSHNIDHIVSMLNNFIDEKGIRRYKTAPNYAIFNFFTEPSAMNGYSKFLYDFDNSFGEKDFNIFFTSYLLKTHKGQCTSMPLLYKILCDELGGQSALAFAPSHLYIKHIGEDGRWVNLELTNGGFARDIWIIESMKVSTEAIRSGIYMRAISEKETIGFMMMQLARAYQNKYKSYDYFVERAVETVLKDLPDFVDACVMKFNLYRERGINFLNKYGDIDTPFINRTYKTFKENSDKLYRLGFSEPTPEEYRAKIEEGRLWLKEQQKEQQ